MNDEELKRYAEESIKDGVAMIYNFTNVPKTWEQCYKELAEAEFIRHIKLWGTFLDLQKEKEFLEAQCQTASSNARHHAAECFKLEGENAKLQTRIADLEHNLAWVPPPIFPEEHQ